MNTIEFSTWVTAFFVLAGFAAILAVAGLVTMLPISPAAAVPDTSTRGDQP